MTQQTSDTSRGWIVTFSALAINLVLGVLYAWGVIARALVEQWHWKRADAMLPFTISGAAFAIMMIFAGRMQDKIGPRIVAILGGILLGVGLITSGCASTPMTMVLTFGVIGGIGIGLGYSATTPPAVKWFPPKRKGLIVGIVVSGVGLAAVYIAPLTQFLLRSNTIPRTFVLLGIGAIVLVILFSMFLRNPPAGYVAAPAPAAGPAKSPSAPKRDLDWQQMLTTPQFYLLWVMFILTASAGLMMIANVSLIAKDQAKMVWGFLPVMLLAIFNTAGRIISGYVSDRIGRTQTMMLAFALQAVNMFLFIHYNSANMVMFGAAFTGLCYGSIYTLMPAATADYYGTKNLGVNYGLVFSAFGVAGVLGPVVGAKIRDVSGTYAWSYRLSAILLLVAVVLAFVTRPPKTEQAGQVS
ncbi:MAG: OFA family MFS transporter [Tepidisphaeraceae bacterium]|jgi:OFA family oxalate/formate antiporter-like MFS transporter